MPSGLRFDQAVRLRTLLALIVTPMVGSVTYVIMVHAVRPDAPARLGGRPLPLLLTALFIATLFEVFVLLPLWHLVRPVRPLRHVVFVAAGAVAWVLCVVGFLTPTDLYGSGLVVDVTRAFVPGLMSVVTFALLAKLEAKDAD